MFTILIIVGIFLNLRGFDLLEWGDEIIDYSKYGKLVGTNTRKYRYVITDRKGLAKAAGEGIFPNNSVLSDPEYLQMKRSGELDGSHWKFVNDRNYKRAFFKWATAPEPIGVRLFYIGDILQRAATSDRKINYRLLLQAIKAYYAIVIHFPKTVAFTYWHTPWYPGVVAIDRIYYLTMKYPELGVRLKDAYIRIENCFNDTTRDDVYIVNPGKLVKEERSERMNKRNLESIGVLRRIGGDITQLIQYESGDWQLIFHDQPILIKAVAYSPAPVGKSPDTGTWNTYHDWFFLDTDRNGKLDVYEVWVDRNKNNRRDKDEKITSDFELMKEMGVNAIRLYHHGYSKELLRDLYENYGIGVLMGDFLGMYAIGSGAGWYEGTDYTNEIHKKNMLESVREMVEKYKDEPYVIMWILGNENNYGVVGDETTPGLGCRAKEQPEAYYKFVNEVAKFIKSIDPHKRPVAICNGDLLYLDYIAKYCKDIDVIGVNAYRGPYGFGYSFWKNIKRLTDKPVLITEYGCPAYGRGFSDEEAEEKQAEYLREAWLDIYYNSAGYGVGNAIGGVQFEWVDEWWKGGPPPRFDPAKHDTIPNFSGPFPDGWFYEEWLGVTSQGDGSHSPFMRQLRRSFFMYKELWRD